MKSTIRFLARAGIIVVIFLGAVVMLNRPSAVKTKVMPAAGPGAPAADPGMPDDAGIPSARAVAEQFTRATTQAGRLQWVRQPGEVAAAMEEFFSNGSGSREQVVEIIDMPPVVTEALAYECFGVRMAAGTMRLLCVVTSGGDAKVDFKAYARHGAQPWPAMMQGQARESAEMRVFIRPGNYYNFGFNDEKRWQNFTATTPDLEDPVEFYIERTDPALKLLEKLVSHNPVRVTVAIRAVGDSHLQGQFEITRFLGAGWVMPE
jgi:hypothetical protein